MPVASGTSLLNYRLAERLGAPHAFFKRKPLGWGLLFGWPPDFDGAESGDRFVFVELEGNPKYLGGSCGMETWSRGFAARGR